MRYNLILCSNEKISFIFLLFDSSSISFNVRFNLKNELTYDNVIFYINLDASSLQYVLEIKLKKEVIFCHSK